MANLDDGNLEGEGRGTVISRTEPEIVDVDVEELTLPDAVQKALKAGENVLVLTGENDEEYYFKRPKTMDINRFLGTSSKGKLAAAVRNLVFEQALSPSAEELRAEFREKPGRVVALNNALQTEIGLNEDYSVKKL
jgi:hypothetical protein